MPHRDEIISRLNADIDELRTTLSQLRAAIVAGHKPVGIKQLLNNAAPPSAEQTRPRDTFQNQPTNSKAARLAQTADAKVTALRASARSVEVELSKLETRLERAEREAWQQKVKRAETTARLNQRERLLQRIQDSAVWKSVKPLWKLLDRGRKTVSEAPRAAEFAFGIDTPERWETNSEILLIKGWCLSRSGREIAGVRAKLGKKGRLGRYGLERDDVAAHFERTALSRHSGFTIEVPVPTGASTVQLEAIVQGGDWEPFFRHELQRSGTATPSDLLDAGERKAAVRFGEVPRLGITKVSKAVDLLAPAFREHAELVQGETPFISILTPTFNTKPTWFAEAAATVLNQSFANWEWCVVDDGSDAPETRRLLEELSAVSPRLRIKFTPNAGISAATNAALEMASGEFVCFLDHDDLLASDALAKLADKVREGFDVVYSDEDKLEETSGRLAEPFHKPDWSPEYLRGAMYVGHLLCLRREIAHAVRFDGGFNGVQDFEFMLRVSEKTPRIGHIAEVLYHWRKTPGSIAEKTDAKPHIEQLQARAVNAHLERLGLPATAERASLPHRLRIVPNRRAEYERVSIIIPTKDSAALLDRCLGSLFERTSHPNFEVVLVDNDTSEPEALEVMQRHPVRRVPFPGPFNFSRANNLGVQTASGSLLVFLNNDTEIVTPDWLQQLAYFAEQQDVGAAGALLVYEDETVQHAGVALGMRGTADHTMRGFPLGVDGYAGSLVCAREVSAVTAACMMMRRSLFDQIGGFNEHFFTAYQDVDLCLRLRDKGLRIIYTPEARVVHHESVSRKRYYDMVDRMLLLDQWEEVIERGDPYYNRHLNLERGDYSLAGVA